MTASSLIEVAPRDRFSSICVLTGAGLSVGAGLPTFRGPDGLWTTDADAEQALDGSRVPDNIPVMWRVWGAMLVTAVRAGPTPAHRAIAELTDSVITQNVDTLHSLAGSERVIEMHGSAGRARCPADGWFSAVTVADSGDLSVADALPGALPGCPRCGAPLRPDVVLFGEVIPPGALQRAVAAATTCELFLAVGTSGVVAPASGLVSLARHAGTYCVNLTMHPGAGNPDFHAEIVSDAQTELPSWAGTV